MGVTRRCVLAASAATAAPTAAQGPAELPAPDRALEITGPETLEQAARATLPPAVFDWIASGAGAELTQRRNRAALDAATVTPRMLTGAGPTVFPWTCSASACRIR